MSVQNKNLESFVKVTQCLCWGRKSVIIYH